MARSASAVATDIGKGSFSRLMNCRFKGIATNTPSDAMSANHANIAKPAGRCPVRINSAGSAAMLPPPVIHPPDDAMDATALFSSNEKGRLINRARFSAEKNANATMVAVMVTPRLHPVFSTT